MNVYFTPSIQNQSLEHIWKTNIQENIQGMEKRTALFTWPRVRLESTVQLITKKEQRIFRTYTENIHNIWYFPIISNKTILTEIADAGQKIIMVEETLYRHFYNGRLCILTNPADREIYEIVEISSVDSSTKITAKDNLTNTWPAGTLIYPFYPTHIKPAQSRTIKQLNLLETSIVAEESFETVHSFSYTLPSIDVDIFPEYNSLHSFLIRPLPPIEEEFQHPYSLLNFLGKQTVFSNYENTRNTMRRNFLITTRKNIQAVLDFFDAQKGRLGAFYTPTWLKDIIITEGFSADATILTVQELYMTESEITGKHLYIQFPDKTYVCKEIIGAPSQTSIIIDSAIGTAVDTEKLNDMLCSFFPEVRFNQDNIKLIYLYKSSLAKIDLNFKTL